MGLDMYLTAERYLSVYNENEKKTARSIKRAVNQLSPFLADKLVNNVSVEIAYWRKANQIHRWFVDNVQDGKDDCRHARVSLEALANLVNICKQVLNDHSLAEELLPCARGFFFGTEDYDEWYYDQLADTIKMIEPCLNEPDANRWSFSYQSSW